MKLVNSAVIDAPACLTEKEAGWHPLSFKVRFGVIGDGHTIVDTGLGPNVTRGPRSRPLRVYAAMMRPRLIPVPAGAPSAILLTHLHADHVARLCDMAPARILVSREALSAARRTVAVFAELTPPELLARAHIVEDLPKVETTPELGMGYAFTGDGAYVAVPLPGHAPGHLGVFWRSADGTPNLYATDAAWTLRALLVQGTAWAARYTAVHDAKAAIDTQRRIRAFAARGGQVSLCHEPGSCPADAEPGQ